MFRTWKKLAWDTSLLAWDAPQVVALRLSKLARGGPAASRETRRIVTEKTIAFVGSAAKLATGSSVGSVVKVIGRRCVQIAGD